MHPIDEYNSIRYMTYMNLLNLKKKSTNIFYKIFIPDWAASMKS